MSVLALSNLSWWASDADIETVCHSAAPSPQITSLRIATDPSSGKSLGRAIVRFADHALPALIQSYIQSLDVSPLPGTDVQVSVLPSPAQIDGFLDQPSSSPTHTPKHSTLPSFPPGLHPPAPNAPPPFAAAPPAFPHVPVPFAPPGMLPPPPGFMPPPGMPPFFMFPPPAAPKPPPTPLAPVDATSSRPPAPSTSDSPRRNLTPGKGSSRDSSRKPVPEGSRSPERPPQQREEHPSDERRSREPDLDDRTRHTRARDHRPSREKDERRSRELDDHRSHDDRASRDFDDLDDRDADGSDPYSRTPEGSPPIDIVHAGSKYRDDRDDEIDRDDDHFRERDDDRHRERVRSPPRIDPRRPNGLSREELDERQRWGRSDRASRRGERDRGTRNRDRRREYSYDQGVEFDGRELHIPPEVKERLLERKENAERRSRRERRVARSRTPSESPPSDYRRERDSYPPGRDRDRHRDRSRSADWPVEDRRSAKRRRHAEYADVLRPDEHDGWRDEERAESRVAAEEDPGIDRHGDGEKSGGGRRSRRRGGKNRKRSYGSGNASAPAPSGQGNGSRSEQRASKRSKGSRR